MKKSTGLKGLYARLIPVKNRKGDETKARIIEAAVAVVADTGFESLTFGAVGARIGINGAQVKYHFPDKEELVRRIIDFMLLTLQESVLGRMKRASRWRDQITAIVDGFFDWADAHENQGSILLMLYYFANQRTPYRELHQQMFEVGWQRIRTILEGREKGTRLSSKELSSRALAVWAVLDGFMIYRLSTGGKRGKKFFREQAHLAVTVLLAD